jgi:omega-6 fatty acid desaturase (delta-12 desaturase)
MNPVATAKSTPTAEEAARAWRASLPRQRRRSRHALGLLIVGVSGAAYLALFAGSLLLPEFWMRGLCLLAAPMAIGSLFVIGHDAAHNTLTPSGRLNRLLGRLTMLPAWHPYTAWCHAHNSMLHGWTNFKGRHPDFAPLSKEEFDALSRWRQWVERVYRHPLGVGLCYAVDFYLKHLMLPRGGDRPPYRLAHHLDRLLVLAFFALQLVGAYALTAYTPNLFLPRELYALLVVAFPWTTWIWFMGMVTYVQHTHPRTAWYDNEQEWSFYHVQLRSTTHVVLPWPIERLLNNIMDHPAHHIDPTIPLYELPASQRLLEQRAPEHSVVVHYWSPMEYVRTCRACKLYDYRRHCWLDFAGNATTPEGLSGR